MFQLIVLIVCSLCLVVGNSQEAAAWWWGESSLVTINEEKLSAQDFRNWWQNWQEEGMNVPDTPDEFINWHLMAQEGSRMQLESEPAYQRKVETFLKVRSLMMLKNEEIDRRSVPSREQMWAIYEKKYCPRWKIEVFFFDSKEMASSKAAALRAGSVTAKALSDLPPKEGGPLFYEAKWLRYPQIKEDWLAALEGTKPGHITEPQAMGKHFILLRFVEERGPEEDDFAKVKATIQSRVRDKLSGEATMALVERLKKKYQVEVDKEFLATISDTPLSMEEAEQAVIKSNRDNISAGALQAVMAKERQFRKQYNFQPEEAEVLKERVVANMIAQTLISWEAMDRHYEEKAPFKAVYGFYRKHRLGKEIEKRFIRPQAKLDEAEIKAYYDDNKQHFSHPEMISFILVEGEEELVNSMRDDISHGEDFHAVVGKHFPGGLPTRQLPVAHLDPELRDPLQSLTKGEVSLPFAMQNNFAMVKLVNHRPAMPVPFQQVREEIEKKLSDEKFKTSRQDFLGQLRERSTIKVNNKAWQKLRKELVQDNETKANN